MRPWFYVAGFGVLAWAALSAGGVIKGGPASGILNWLTGLLAIGFGLIAGVYATHTWLLSAAGGVVSIHPVIGLAVFVLTLLGLLATIPVLLIDRISALSVTPVIVAAWVLLPSLLQVGAIPGEAGDRITLIIRTIAEPLIAETRWFG